MIALYVTSLVICGLVIAGLGVGLAKLFKQNGDLFRIVNEGAAEFRRERAALLGVLAAERREHREELSELFNRIQHPRVYQPSPEQLAHERAIQQEHRQEVDDEFEQIGQAGVLIAADNGDDGD